jgi:hypothetical protein
VQVECIITQLVFEHSLRIRFKAETDDSKVGSEGSTVTESATPDTESDAGLREASEGDTFVHSQDNTESTITPSNSSTQENAKSAKAAKAESPRNADNLLGKINNLVTSDLGNITDSRDFLWMFIYIPFEAMLCMVFLYSILGWRYVSRRYPAAQV